jgi:hypothetical protein
MGFACSDSFGPSCTMRGPCFCGGIPFIARGIVESAVATGPFWKIGEGVLVEEAEVLVNQFGGQLSNFNLQCAGHDGFVFP